MKLVIEIKPNSVTRKLGGWASKAVPRYREKKRATRDALRLLRCKTQVAVSKLRPMK